MLHIISHACLSTRSSLVRDTRCSTWTNTLFESSSPMKWCFFNLLRMGLDTYKCCIICYHHTYTEQHVCRFSVHFTWSQHASDFHTIQHSIIDASLQKHDFVSTRPWSRVYGARYFFILFYKVKTSERSNCVYFFSIKKIRLQN